MWSRSALENLLALAARRHHLDPGVVHQAAHTRLLHVDVHHIVEHEHLHGPVADAAVRDEALVRDHEQVGPPLVVGEHGQQPDDGQTHEGQHEADLAVQGHAQYVDEEYHDEDQDRPRHPPHHGDPVPTDLSDRNLTLDER